MNSIANGTKHIEGLGKALKVEVNAGDKKKDFLAPHLGIKVIITIHSILQFRHISMEVV